MRAKASVAHKPSPNFVRTINYKEMKGEERMFSKKMRTKGLAIITILVMLIAALPITGSAAPMAIVDASSTCNPETGVVTIVLDPTNMPGGVLPDDVTIMAVEDNSITGETASFTATGGAEGNISYINQYKKEEIANNTITFTLKGSAQTKNLLVKVGGKASTADAKFFEKAPSTPAIATVAADGTTREATITITGNSFAEFGSLVVEDLAVFSDEAGETPILAEIIDFTKTPKNGATPSKITFKVTEKVTIKNVTLTMDDDTKISWSDETGIVLANLELPQVTVEKNTLVYGIENLKVTFASALPGSFDVKFGAVTLSTSDRKVFTLQDASLAPSATEEYKNVAVTLSAVGYEDKLVGTIKYVAPTKAAADAFTFPPVQINNDNYTWPIAAPATLYGTEFAATGTAAAPHVADVNNTGNPVVVAARSTTENDNYVVTLTATFTLDTYKQIVKTTTATVNWKGQTDEVIDIKPIFNENVLPETSIENAVMELYPTGSFDTSGGNSCAIIGGATPTKVSAADGSISAAAGEYEMVIKVPGHVAMLIKVKVSASGITDMSDNPIENLAPTYGDFDGDSEVGGLDYGLIMGYFGTPNLPEDVLTIYDADGDGEVGGLDYGILMGAFGIPALYPTPVF